MCDRGAERGQAVGAAVGRDPADEAGGQLLVAVGGEGDPPPAAAQVEVSQLLVEEDDVELVDARRATRGFG